MPDQKKQYVLYDSIYLKLESANKCICHGRLGMRRKEITNGDEETCGDDEYLHYLDHTVDLMSIHLYGNLSN